MSSLRVIAVLCLGGWGLLASPAASAQESVEIRGDGRMQGTEGRARSEVTRADIEERLPRSAPDALSFEPGITVQQTSHGQGAPFVRGRYGSRVLILYDGVRLNNATFRQGPSQYLFTLDAQTIQSIEVIRGGASTLFGTDALGGAILARSVVPQIPDEETPSWGALGRAQYRTADRSHTLRGQIQGASGRLAASLGGGFSSAGQLRSAGSVRNLSNPGQPEVPRFASDGVTQLGTGYQIATGDTRLRAWLRPDLVATAALDLFRQYDTPRTDQCPPPFGVLGDCTTIDEQFRTLAYLGLDGDLGGLARQASLRASFQRQHERKTRVRPLSTVENGSIDDVDTLGLSASFQTARRELAPGVASRAVWGADVYRDSLSSRAWTTFTDTNRVFPYKRGQYIDGSSYLTGGVFFRAEADVRSRVTLVAGGRLGLHRAVAAEDPEGGTVAIDKGWLAFAGEARVGVRAASWVTLFAGVDRSFRAPNLDELTSRQQTGPGFQLDNPALGPETQITTEFGAVFQRPGLRAELWAYRAVLDDAIDASPRSVSECPPGPSSDSCASSWSRYQVINAPEPSRVHGVEAALRLRPVSFFRIQGTVAWTHGEGPNLGGSVPWGQLPNPDPIVPLSRIPPLNGSFEARWSARGAYAGWALRWATAQTRLSVSDRSDYRIPYGGTPGFAVFDIRAGYRFQRKWIVNAVMENAMNRPYRIHGSGINGAARGLSLSVEVSL